MRVRLRSGQFIDYLNIYGFSTMQGKTLSNYTIIDTLGSGGMGTVYLARDDRLDRTVALKVLPVEVAGNEDRKRRFRLEAKAASKIKHPNVAHIYDIGEADGVSFIVMEHIEGQTVLDRLVRDPMSFRELIDLASQLADALSDAHALQITHRDIKPANLMLTDRGQLKVLDFGLAKLADDSNSVARTQLETQRVTQEGQLLGTVLYMSPEQARGEPVDPRTDIFSVGSVLYEALTGDPPFRAPSSAEIIGRLLHENPAPLSEAVPEKLASIVMRCLEKDPAKRFADGGQLLEELRGLDTEGDAQANASLSSVTTLSGSLTGSGKVLGEISTLAVMPFENRTKQEEVEYLCDGLTENLIGRLARLPNLKVLSHHATLPLRDEALDPAALGARLGVDALVFGQLSQRTDRIIVSAELVSARDSSQLWSERFDRPLAETVTIEHEVAENIARHLREELSTDGPSPIETPAVNPLAYLLYLKAKPFVVGTEDQMHKAEEFLKQAIEIDPSYALAHATLSYVYANHAFHSVGDPNEARRGARESANRALELDPDLSEAQAAVANVRFYIDWDWQGADQAFRRAVELGPSSDTPYLEYSEFLSGIGKPEDGLEVAKKGREIDPISPNSTHLGAFALLLLGRFDEAIQQFKEALAKHPNWTWGHIKIAFTYAENNMFEEALKSAARAEAALHEGGAPLASAWLGFVYGVTGETNKARQSLEEIRAMKGRYIDPLIIGYFHLGLGEKDKLLDCMEQAYLERSPLSAHMGAVQFLCRRVGIADEPRFKALLKKMAYPD